MSDTIIGMLRIAVGPRNRKKIDDCLPVAFFVVLSEIIFYLFLLC